MRCEVVDMLTNVPETASPNESNPTPEKLLDPNTLVKRQGPDLLVWLSRWSLRLIEFAAVQGLVQLALAASGLLIVRNLTKQDYAFFAIANSMTTTVHSLADLGIGIGVRSIGGRVCDDPYRFGQLLNTALRLRRLFGSASFCVCLPTAAWMLWHNGASVTQTALLCLAIGIAGILLLASSVWAVSPALHGQYRRLQKIDLSVALLRLGFIAVLAATRINAVLAVFVGLIGYLTQNTVYRRWAQEKAIKDAPPNIEDRRELVRLSVRSLPNTVFFCFQGQVTLIILTLLGTPTGLADVVALGRLAALLGVFSVTFANVLCPRFTRCQEPRRLPRLYVFLVACSVALLAPLTLLAWLWPGPALWLLGSQYQGLEGDLVWVVASACVANLSGIMWQMNSSKAWIRVQTYLYIPALLFTQVAMALCLDLRTFHNVLIFGLISSAAIIPLSVADAWLGLRRSRPREPVT